MGAEEVGVQPDAANPLGDEPRVLPRRHAPSLTASADKQCFARFLTSYSYVVIDRLSGLLGQFKPDGLPGLLLPHRRPIDRIPARCNILDLEGNDIAATQLAVDGQIEHRRDKHDLYTAEAIASRWSLRRERASGDPPRRRIRSPTPSDVV